MGGFTIFRLRPHTSFGLGFPAVTPKILKISTPITAATPKYSKQFKTKFQILVPCFPQKNCSFGEMSQSRSAK